MNPDSYHGKYAFYHKNLNKVSASSHFVPQKLRQQHTIVSYGFHGNLTGFVEYTLMYPRMLSNTCRSRYFYKTKCVMRFV